MRIFSTCPFVRSLFTILILEILKQLYFFQSDIIWKNVPFALIQFQVFLKLIFYV